MAPTVTTSYGTLEGIVDKGTQSFRGIPFAKPPVGELRFRAPEPPSPWTGTRDATRFGHGSWQAEPVGPDMLGMRQESVDEDCLTLNVWTPSLDGSRPVMVWIHGGAFVVGSGSQAMYNGAQLAMRGDTVVVTVNYRLGIFGFLPGKSLAGCTIDSTGNEAILDDIAALRWVRDEIAAFGGDPDNVTIFGESAGSISIAALLAAPAARGLYQKAILQSGSANVIVDAVAAAAIMRTVLDEAGLAPEMADQLRTWDAKALHEFQMKILPKLGGTGFGPVWEPDVLPRSTFDLAAEGALADIPIMIGTTADEMRLFMMMDPQGMQLEEADLLARCEEAAPGHGQQVIDTYRAARAARGESTSPADVWWASRTDSFFRAPSMKLASLASRHGSVFTYLMTQKSPMANGLLGACHALDLPFVFGLGNDPRLRGLSGEGPELDRLSLNMQDAWLAFARTGNPSHEGLPAWSAYDETSRATMVLDSAESRLENAPREAERALWD